MKDHLDVSLVDEARLSEMELLTDLIIAASEGEQMLGQREIDEILGIPSVPRQRPGAD